MLAAGVWLEKSTEFIFNPNLGGRTLNFGVISPFSLTPQPFIQVMEIVYLSMMGNLGRSGVSGFFHSVVLPICSCQPKTARLNSPRSAWSPTSSFLSWKAHSFTFPPNSHTGWLLPLSSQDRHGNLYPIARQSCNRWRRSSWNSYRL